jgi:hypothetical protein
MRAVDHIDPPRIGITSRCPSVVRLPSNALRQCGHPTQPPSAISRFCTASSPEPVVVHHGKMARRCPRRVDRALDRQDRDARPMSASPPIAVKHWRRSETPLRANSRHMQSSKFALYSIRSSTARTISAADCRATHSVLSRNLTLRIGIEDRGETIRSPAYCKPSDPRVAGIGSPSRIRAGYFQWIACSERLELMRAKRSISCRGSQRRR